MSQTRSDQDIKSAGNYGRSAPLGPTVCDGGLNFSIFSREALGVDLLLFDRQDDPRPSRVMTMDPSLNRTYYYWHAFVPDLQPGQIYAYRVHGLFDPSNGLRFDHDKILLDPYGRGIVVPNDYRRDAAFKAGE